MYRPVASGPRWCVALFIRVIRSGDKALFLSMMTFNPHILFWVRKRYVILRKSQNKSKLQSVFRVIWYVRPVLLVKIAKAGQRAYLAFRPAGHANIPAMQN